MLIYLLVLHPRYKLQYFKAVQWEADWISTAEKLLQDEYACSYTVNVTCVEVREKPQTKEMVRYTF